MKIIPIYKYIRLDGGVSVSPNKPDCEYTDMFRIIADEGMLIANGTQITCCIDTDSAEGWIEVIDESYVNEESYLRE